MRRIRTWALNTATAISLLLLLTTLTFWWRSYRYMDTAASFNLDADRFLMAISLYGGVQVGRARELHRDWILNDPFLRISAEHSVAVNDHKTMQIPRDLQLFAGFRPTKGPYQLGFYFARGRNVGAYRYWTARIPDASLATLSAILPALQLRYILRKRQGRQAGKCPTCGYDLRATPDRCPECGTVSIKSAKPQLAE